MIILTPRGEILRGAPDRGRLSVVLYVFHFLIIAPTVDFFHTKLLTYCRFRLPSLVQVYYFVSGVLDSSLVLAIVEFGVWLFEVVDRVSCILIMSSNRLPFLQVTSGGQRSLLKKKLQVCESQQSCLFVGNQILIFHHNLQINSLKSTMWFFWIFFFLFVSIVEVYLWWNYRPLSSFYVGELTIGGWLTTFFLPHCMEGQYIWHLIFSLTAVISLSQFFYFYSKSWRPYHRVYLTIWANGNAKNISVVLSHSLLFKLTQLWPLPLLRNPDNIYLYIYI